MANPNAKLYPIFSKRKLQITHLHSSLKIKQSFIHQAYEIINQNISDETFGIPEFCKSINLSRSQVHNKIKTRTGLSTSIFIRNIRLKKAKLLLQNSDLNISEIAYSVGFKDPSYFSRLYSEKFGIAPSKFRQNISKPIFLTI